MGRISAGPIITVLAACSATAASVPKVVMTLSQRDANGREVPRATILCHPGGDCRGFMSLEIGGVEAVYWVRGRVARGKASLSLEPEDDAPLLDRGRGNPTEVVLDGEGAGEVTTELLVVARPVGRNPLIDLVFRRDPPPAPVAKLRVAVRRSGAGGP